MNRIAELVPDPEMLMFGDETSNPIEQAFSSIKAFCGEIGRISLWVQWIRLVIISHLQKLQAISKLLDTLCSM